MLTLFPSERSEKADGRLSKPGGRTFRLALVGGFKPRKCGIATFTTDIFEQMTLFDPGLRIDVYAMAQRQDDPVDGAAYRVLAEQDRVAMRQAAQRMNDDAVDAVWLQHEYGIFGGPDGEFVLDLVDRVAAPLVVTLHTVLEHPSERQEAILRHIIAKAVRLVVMSEHSRHLLLHRYGADETLIAVIEHGAPDRPAGREAEMKAAMGIAPDRPVLMTFGLLGPGKGLENAIAALPAIVARHPDVLYRIVGATHPNLVAQQGEAYREGLVALAEQLGVTANIEWADQFLETPALLDQLEACDIYLTPYPNLQQSTSGTLSYAVALGKAVVSTPYVHARELLSEGAGTLVEPGDSAGIAAAVIALLDDPAALDSMKKCAYARGRETIWPAFASASWAVLDAAAASEPQPYRLGGIMRAPAFSAVRMMTDGTGMLQHSIGMVPDRRHGYCLDDNARALMLVSSAGAMDDGERLALSMTYASFIQYSWNEDKRRFRNFMGYDRSWLEEQGSEDSNGRAIWALGHAMAQGCAPGIADWARQWFERTAQLACDLHSPRAIAYSLLGADQVLRAAPGHALAHDIMMRGGEILNRLLQRSMRPDWTWFEAVLGYDNPRLAEALLRAGAALDQPKWIEEGLDALGFICDRQTGASGNFRPIGSDGLGMEYDHLPFDQQPLEALAAIEACFIACAVDGSDSRWRSHAEAAYGWFYGKNDRGESLVDGKTGLCRDGLTARGVNGNSGAESILAFQLSYHAICELTRICAREGGMIAQTGSGGVAKPVAAA